MKPLVPAFLKSSRLYRLVEIVASTRGYLRTSGWWASLWRGVPVASDGAPIPWVTLPSISFLEPRLRPDFQVLEFGCGHSTHWFAARVRNVVSIEHDREWAATSRAEAPENVTIHLAATGQTGSYVDIAHGTPNDHNSYVQKIDDLKQRFDVILVDGVYRHACIRRCPDLLTDVGVIIVDNTDYPEIATSLQWLEGHGFRKLDFHGLHSGLSVPGLTSIFYRNQNCLKL